MEVQEMERMRCQLSTQRCAVEYPTTKNSKYNTSYLLANIDHLHPRRNYIIQLEHRSHLGLALPYAKQYGRGSEPPECCTSGGTCRPDQWPWN